MNVKEKIYSLFLILMMVISLLPSRIYGASETLKEHIEAEDNWYFIEDNMGIHDLNPNLTNYSTSFGESKLYNTGDVFTVKYLDILPDEVPGLALRLTVEILKKDITGELNQANVNRDTIDINPETKVTDVNAYFTKPASTRQGEFESAAVYKITYEFFMGDPDNGGEPYNYECLVGILDPDNGHYYFDPEDASYETNYFWGDAWGQESWNKQDSSNPQLASEYLLYQNGGIERDFENGIVTIDGEQQLGGFDYTKLLVSLKGRSKYTFTVAGWRDGSGYPVLYGINKYTVTYEDGVDGEDVFEDQVFEDLMYGTETPSYTAPEREGYKFLGWDKTIPAQVTEDAVYKAKWAPVMKTSVYLRDDDTKENLAFVGTYTGNSNDVVPCVPDDKIAEYEELGYTVVNNPFKNEVRQPESTIPAEATVYIDMKKPAEAVYHKVTYKPGEQGDFEAEIFDSVVEGLDRPEPTSTQGKEGYNFEGWINEDDILRTYKLSKVIPTGNDPELELQALQEEVLLKLMVDMEITIVDDENLIICMVSKEGTSGGEQNVEVKYNLETGKATADVDGTSEEMSVYIKDGYFYLGTGDVFLKFKPEIKENELAEKVYQDLNYVAVWQPEEKISYKVNHLLETEIPGQYELKETEDKEGVVDDPAIAEFKTYPNYHANYQKSELIKRIAADGSTELNLYYDAGTYIVEYDPGEHGVFDYTAYEDLRYGTKTPQFTGNLSAVGYVFAGWNTVGGKVDEIVTEDKYYEAVWVPINYKITYKPNGVKGTPQTQDLVYDKKDNIKKNMFDGDEYEFVEWNTRDDGKGRSYKEGQEILNLTQKDGDEIVLYAIWKKKSTNKDTEHKAPPTGDQ